jgi:hypothetical protein
MENRDLLHLFLLFILVFAVLAASVYFYGFEVLKNPQEWSKPLPIIAGLVLLAFPEKFSRLMITTAMPGKGIKTVKEDFGPKASKWMVRILGIIFLVWGIVSFL